MHLLAKVVTALCLIPSLLHASQKSAPARRPTGPTCADRMLRNGTPALPQVAQRYAVLFDQVFKSGGPHAGRLVTRLAMLARSSPEIADVLEGLQDKVKTVLATKPGTTLIELGTGALVERPEGVPAPFAQAPDLTLVSIFAGAPYWIRASDLHVDAGVEGPVEHEIREGLRVTAHGYRLKSHLTPPVAKALLTMLVTIALADPKSAPLELAQLPAILLVDWTTLAAAEKCLNAVARATVTGHARSLGEALHEITIDNAGQFDHIRLDRFETTARRSSDAARSRAKTGDR